MEQPEFDFWTRARGTDPDTSFEAAEAVFPKINRIQLEVLTHFRSIYPRAITDYDLQQHFDNHMSTYRTRRSELTAMCLIVDSGQRKFQAGRNRILWVAALKPCEA